MNTPPTLLALACISESFAVAGFFSDGGTAANSGDSIMRRVDDEVDDDEVDELTDRVAGLVPVLSKGLTGLAAEKAVFASIFCFCRSCFAFPIALLDSDIKSLYRSTFHNALGKGAFIALACGVQHMHAQSSWDFNAPYCFSESTFFKQESQ